ncbi:CBS domain-containing protein [Lysobacter antibioticus]|uniref:CBS domain-containing protein n=1 Tax=Lysobacter antibioticus TaxID=84531 RepID=UPI0007E8E7A6|nr:CBS domain-containing protein [Lysobacter antibioticus]
MRVRDICRQAIHVIGPSTTAREAAEIMRDAHVATLLVADELAGEPVLLGVVTDRDLVLKVMAMGASAEAVSVADAMTRDVVICRDDQDIAEAVNIMRSSGVRRLPVLGGAGRPIGLITADDVYAALSAQMRDLGQMTLRERVHELESFE